MAAATPNMSRAPAMRRRACGARHECRRESIRPLSASHRRGNLSDTEQSENGEGIMRRGFQRLGALVPAIAALLLAGMPGARAADDAKTCIKESGDAAIEACTRAINAKRYSAHVLARQYLARGVERRVKQDYAMALTDFAEALKIDKKYADAFYNRCAIYNFKKEYDSAITECSQAIKLGAGNDAMMAGGGERLGKDQALSDYYAARGFP